MATLRDETLDIRSSADVVKVRQVVRTWSSELGFSLVDQTKLVTGASELARNTVEHGGGGKVRIEMVNDEGRRGLRMTFEDRGPGIPDVSLALTDGYSTRDRSRPRPQRHPPAHERVSDPVGGGPGHHGAGRPVALMDGDRRSGDA